MIHVLNVKRHIMVLNIARRHQNRPYILLSILNSLCCLVIHEV